MVVFLVIFLSFGFLIFIHEFFHFLFAKKFGVKVESFSVGFPPFIFRKKKGETEYLLGLVPFGGFVKLFGEEERINHPRSFYGKEIWKRFLIISGGPLGNILLAFFLFFLAGIVGAPVIGKNFKGEIQKSFLQIVEVKKDSPAFKAGIKPGDIILGAKVGKKLEKFSKEEDLLNFVKKQKGKTQTFVFKRGRKVFEKEIYLRENPPSNEGPMGIAFERVFLVKFSFWESFLLSAKKIYYLTRSFFEIPLRIIFKKEKIPLEVSGPVGISKYFFMSFYLGGGYFLQFLGVLSFSLGIINLFPFPALDGGRIVFLGIEAIRRKPLSMKTENLINQIGFLILIFLMILVTINDIQKIFK